MLRLKSLRKYNDMTRKEFAEKLGVSEPTVAAYEQGTREPSVSMIIKMCDILNTNIPYLLGTESEINNCLDDLSSEEKAYILIMRSKKYFENKKDMK